MVFEQLCGNKTLYGIKILKNLNNKLEYLKWCVYEGKTGIHRVGKETYLYDNSKIEKWWYEEFLVSNI